MLCGRWFAEPKRYGWYVAIRLSRVIVAPYFNLAAVLLVKRLVIGRFRPGPRDLSQRGLLQYWLMARLMPGGDLGKVAPLVGRNLEVVSWIYRMLGAKIGKRIWWPGAPLLFKARRRHSETASDKEGREDGTMNVQNRYNWEYRSGLLLQQDDIMGIK
jgi:hypothetical protein